MALTKEQKTKQISDLKEKIKDQKSVVFADFSKVPSKEMFDLRRSLKDAGCNLKIAKKTLLRKAFGQSNISFWARIKSAVPGQLALIFGFEDEIAPYRVSYQFAKKNENFKLLGGIFESKFIDKEKTLMLAAIPSRNELLSRFVGSISSPVARFAIALNKIREQKEVKV